MYADRIEKETRSIKSRITGGAVAVPDKSLAVRGRVTFKRGGPQNRVRGRSDVDEKWKHDLFEEAESFLQPQGNGSTDLRSLLASKQQAKVGVKTRLSGRLGVSGVSSAKAAVLAASDLRQGLGAGTRRRGAGTSRVTARRKPATAAAAAAVGAQAQKRITVTLRNDEGVEEIEEEREEEIVVAPVKAAVRGGRGSLIVTSRTEPDDGMEVDEEEMPGHLAIGARRQTRSSSKSKENVASFLSSLGLAKYTATFAAEEIDMPALSQMREEDLKELGIPMGPRKKILQAVGVV